MKRRSDHESWPMYMPYIFLLSAGAKSRPHSSYIQDTTTQQDWQRSVLPADPPQDHPSLEMVNGRKICHEFERKTKMTKLEKKGAYDTDWKLLDHLEEL